MGEYADIQIREDIKRMHGFDPGDMNDDIPRKKKLKLPRSKCAVCGATVKTIGLKDHMRDKHSMEK